MQGIMSSLALVCNAILPRRIPDWAGLWLGLYPSWEGLFIPPLALVYVGGAWLITRWRSSAGKRELALAAGTGALRPADSYSSKK